MRQGECLSWLLSWLLAPMVGWNVCCLTKFTRTASVRKGHPSINFAHLLFALFPFLQRELELKAVIEKATAELQKNSERREVSGDTLFVATCVGVCAERAALSGCRRRATCF